MSCESNGVRRLLGAVIYANQSDTRLNSDRVAIELGQLVFFAKPLRTDTTREFFFKRKLINYTKNELQGINILKLRLPNGFKCCLNFFIVGMGTNVK